MWLRSGRKTRVAGDVRQWEIISAPSSPAETGAEQLVYFWNGNERLQLPDRQMTFQLDAADRARLWAGRHRRLVENVALGRRAKINELLLLLRSSEDRRRGSANCSDFLLVDLVLALAYSDSVFTTRPSLLHESVVNHGSPRNFTAVLPPRSPFVSLLRHTSAWEFQAALVPWKSSESSESGHDSEGEGGKEKWCRKSELFARRLVPCVEWPAPDTAGIISPVLSSHVDPGDNGKHRENESIYVTSRTDSSIKEIGSVRLVRSPFKKD